MKNHKQCHHPAEKFHFNKKREPPGTRTYSRDKNKITILFSVIEFVSSMWNGNFVAPGDEWSVREGGFLEKGARKNMKIIQVK